MTACDALGAALQRERELRRQLAIGLPELEQRYRAALDAFVPPSRPFERKRIIADLVNPRELAFVIGLLSEGENEAALILGLIGDAISADAHAFVDHLIDEAWYYLRTSIDSEWQLDDGLPSVAATIVYLSETLDARIARLRSIAGRAPLADTADPAARTRLRELRASFAT